MIGDKIYNRVQEIIDSSVQGLIDQYDKGEISAADFTFKFMPYIDLESQQFHQRVQEIIDSGVQALINQYHKGKISAADFAYESIFYAGLESQEMRRQVKAILRKEAGDDESGR